MNQQTIDILLHINDLGTFSTFLNSYNINFYEYNINNILSIWCLEDNSKIKEITYNVVDNTPHNLPLYEFSLNNHITKDGSVNITPLNYKYDHHSLVQSSIGIYKYTYYYIRINLEKLRIILAKLSFTSLEPKFLNFIKSKIIKK